jgi:hypothetical protein
MREIYGLGSQQGGAREAIGATQSASPSERPRTFQFGGDIGGCTLAGEPPFTDEGSRVWSTEGMARDPAAYLTNLFEAHLPAKGTRARDEILSTVVRTIKCAESQACASLQGDLDRVTKANEALQLELQEMQLELEATERNRKELAQLLQATIESMPMQGGGEARRVAAAVMIQRRWRKYVLRGPKRRGTRRGANGYDPYDIIVTFDSLAKTIDPEVMRIDILRWAYSAFSISDCARQGIRLVAHMGLFDKGKTFLANKLYGKSLPSGKLHETTGLSMVYIPDLRFLVIDTKGLQAPVSYKGKGVKQLVDASQTEVFLFELVSRIAHYILFVVNDFTWPEQRHIVQLHQKYVQSKRENQLVVIHNLRTTRSVHEAEELFFKQVASKYEGVDRKELGGLVFTVEEKPRIHHIGFAEEHTLAGRRFNDKNAQHVLQLLDQLEGVGERTKSVGAMLQETFAALLPEFIYLEAEDGQRRDASTLQVKAEMQNTWCSETLDEPDRESEPTMYKTAGSLTIELPEKLRACMKTEGVFSEFCELVAQDVTFKPPAPNIYEMQLKDKIIRMIEFEIPGVTRQEISFQKSHRGYTVKMKRTKDKQLNEFGVSPKFHAPRTPIGEFSFDLFFDEGAWELDGGKEAVSHENGILRIRLKQETKTQTWSVDDL